MPEPSGRPQQSGSSLSRLLVLLVLVALLAFLAYSLLTCNSEDASAPSGSQAAQSTQSATTTQASQQGAGEEEVDVAVTEEAGTDVTTETGRGLMSLLFGQQANIASTQGTAGNTIQIDGLRDHFVDPSAAKSATVIVYMCGADLETYSSAASKDLQEMVNATLGENVKVVIQTGGAKKWHFASVADPRTRQRWLIDNDGMYLVGDAGSGTMLDTASVTDFANWAIQNYPADRYMFYFWDHGGGTIGGYGSDEVYPNARPLSLLELRTALANTGQKFDMVGFDACLMGTIETAYAMEPVADYLLASEEYEMGDGWAWTGFLSALGQNPAIDTVELGKVAIDDFTEYYFNQRLGNITLSIVDLREVPYVYEQMGEFLAAAESTINTDNNRFVEMSQARTRARSFADGGIDQVDVIDLIDRTTFEGKDDLKAAVDSCVKYRSGSTISGANGLAMYFPYSEVRQYQGMRAILNDIGYVSPTQFYDYFLSIMSGSPVGTSGGGLVASGSASQQQGSAESAAPSSNSYADQTFTMEDWFNALLGGGFNYQNVPDSLSMEYQDGEYVVAMDNNLWNVFGSWNTTVMEEYNNGYLMLGRDDVYDQTDDGNIAIFFNNEWLTMGGNQVSFFASEPYQEANGEYSHSGVIPALLNGDTYIEIFVYWPPQSQQGDTYTGYVQGYRIEGNDYNTFGRGLQPFNRGDQVTFLFDLYDRNGQYSQTVPGATMTINSASDLEVTYQLVESTTVHFWGTMTTVYGDKVDTPVVTQ